MKIKIIYRRLGREKAWGQAHTDDNTIELDERLKGKKHLEILIHEVYHLQNPEWSETEVLAKSKQLTNPIWNEHYRRVDNSVKL